MIGSKVNVKLFKLMQSKESIVNRRFFSAPPLRPFRPRRSFLYMPASNTKILNKAQNIKADTICFDLEDGVALSEKKISRTNIQSKLNENQSHSFKPEIAVRMNACGSGFEDEDIRAILDESLMRYPESIVLPKVESADQIKWLHNKLEARGSKGSNINIIGMIETVEGMININSIFAASPRLVAFIFGGDDFAADLGAVRTVSNRELLTARQNFVFACKAHNYQSIDIVNIDIKGLTENKNENFKEECLEGMQFGFTGKQCIHPLQLPIVDSIFGVSEDRVKTAIEILTEHHKMQNLGQGAFTLNGKMIDMPTVKAANRVLIKAEACGVSVQKNLFLKSD